jgi:hypothetical protein
MKPSARSLQRRELAVDVAHHADAFRAVAQEASHVAMHGERADRHVVHHYVLDLARGTERCETDDEPRASRRGRTYVSPVKRSRR